MKKNIIKIKFSTFITIIIVSILIMGGIIAVVLCNKNNNSNNEMINENTNNKEGFIKIRYAYNYNITHADVLNKMKEEEEPIDILEINLEGENFKKINSLLEKQSYKEIKGLQLLIYDMYEINVNDEIKLSICPGEKYAHYTKGTESYLIRISEELVNEIDKIVQAEVSRNAKQ